MLMDEKRSFRFARRGTTIKLEEPFWDELERIARENDVSLGELIEEIDRSLRAREGLLVGKRNLASCLRVFCLMKNIDMNVPCNEYLKEMT